MKSQTESWAEKLRSHLHQLPATQEKAPPAPPVESVVVEADFTRSGGLTDRRPVLEAATNAVTRMVDLIEGAEQRADQAERELQKLAERACAQLDESQAQIKALEEALAHAEARAKVSARATAEQLKALELRAATAENRCEELAGHLTTSSETISRLENLIVAANDRVFAAETRASEAKEDITYLENFIREQLGRLGSAASNLRKPAAA